MKKALLSILCAFFLLPSLLRGQKMAIPVDTSHFNYAYWNAVADKEHLNASERQELLRGQKAIYIQEQLHAHDHDHDEVSFDSLVWVVHDTERRIGPNSVNAGPCTNIDWEDGNFNGWIRSTGFNPLTNATGCCPTPNGDQTIMTGGLDPFGNFPRVWPGGGTRSLRLGSAAIGGRADRVQQTFFVTPANANFTYRYAVVLNDPGHTPAQQPRFVSEIIDTLGNVVNCTVYSVTAAGSIPGFTTSALTPTNGGAVRCRNWSDVAVDLSPNIGQNVTIRFTVYDCSPTGHFAYAYIDGICTNFETAVADTTCPNIPINICAPTGFSTTTWNGPGVVNNPNRCINIVNPGTYSCTTLLVPGCPGPTFVHTLSLLPDPIISFTPIPAGPCLTQYTFNGNVSMTTGSITSYQWYFGDGTTAGGSLNQVHTYPSPGTYQVKLKAFSDRGCADSLTIPVTIAPTPVLAFSPPSNCVNTLVQFTNSSNVPVGSITGYTWNLGNGVFSNLQNPTNTYTTNGTYTIVLNAISDQSCTASLTQTLGIYPPPIIGFSANPLCDANGTSFTPITSTAIVSGSLTTYLWDFGDGNFSNQANPTHIYSAPGLYTVTLNALSDHNCPASFTNSFIIAPSPTVSINTTSINACSPNFTFSSNTSISAGTATHLWDFGGGVTSTLTSLSYTFPGIGNYTVKLIGTSNLGCGDTAVQYISIYPYPVINFSVPASCENAIFTVTTTALSGSVTSYLWNFGDPASGAANTSTLQNPTHAYLTTGNYTITLNLISNLNCPSTTVTPITVFPNPNAMFSFTRSTNCALPHTFFNTSSVSTIGASSLSAFQWNFGAAGSSTLSNPGTVNFPGPGTYSVSLIARTNRNCTDTMNINIDVHPSPVLDFTMTPDCVGDPIPVLVNASISPVPNPGSSIISYTWNFGNGVTTFVGTPPAQTYSAAGLFTVNFGATSNMNCVSAITRTLNIYPNPVINFTTTSNLCFGNNTNFTSTNSVSQGVMLSYAWDFGDGNTGLGANIVHTYTNSGVYTVNFSVTTNFECMSVLSKTLAINPLPAVTFSANGGCLNTPSQFVNTSTISSGGISLYTYSFGDGSSSNSLSPVHTYSTHGTFNPTLTAVSNQGCTSNATTAVVIHPLPNVAFTATTVCENTVIQFTNSSNIPTGSISTYTWSFGDGNSSLLVAPQHNFSVAGTYVTTLSATSDQGCLNSALRSYTIRPYPIVSFPYVGNSCASGTAVIQPSISVSGSNSISGYTVNFGDGSSNSTYTTLGIPVSHVYNTQGNYTVTLWAGSNGCVANSNTTISVYARPVANFSYNGICHQSATTFSNLSSISAGSSIGGYYWVFGDGVATSTLNNPSHMYSGPGTYSIQLNVMSYPEPTLVCSAISTRTITVHPLAGSSFKADTVCFGNPTSFVNQTNPNGVIAWNWYFYNLSQSQNFVPSPAFTYSAPGTYTAYLVTQMLLGSCRDTASRKVIVNPNPVSSFLADSVCLGNITTFTATSTIGFGGSVNSFTWNFGAGNQAFGSNVTHSFTSAGILTVQLSSTSDQGCTTSTVAPVRVYHLPNVNFSANEACEGLSTNFINLSVIQQGNIQSYLWNLGNGTQSSSVNPVVTYSGSGTYSVNLQGISDRNCVSNITKTVVVHENPVADFYFPNRACAESSVNITNLSVSGDGSITGNAWDFTNDGIIDNIQINPSVVFTQWGPKVIRLAVQTQYGCVNTKTLTTFVNPKPVVNFKPDQKEGCPVHCVNFASQSSVASGSIASFQWNFGDGTANSNDANPKHCYYSGVYNVTLTVVSDSGCSNRGVQPNAVTVFDLPVAGFDVNPEEIDEEQPVISVSNASSDAKLIKYHINDGSTYTRPNFEHTFDGLGDTYPMIVQVVTSEEGCSDTTFKVLKIKPSFAIYFPNVFTPNGDGDNDTYQPKGVGIAEFNLRIYDRWGHLVFESNDIYNQWDGHLNSSNEPIKQDVYIWKARVTDIFDKIHNYVGHVTLLK